MYEEEKEMLSQLNNDESLGMVIAATVISLIPALALGMTLVIMGRILIVMWILPGVIVGLATKFMAKPYSFKFRIIPAISITVAMAIGAFFLQLEPTVYLIALTNGVAAMALSKRKLSAEQQRAIWLRKQNKI
jgi:hypothetical protein|tara:strand:- start:47 stop:445 length:399 start_codon:yes stop_codon:yes gene_type:complete